ncbi:MAG: UMP kinase [Phycisphaerae bacterium]|nr:UMP kinase [Phycisphaerae bacterium]
MSQFKRILLKLSGEALGGPDGGVSAAAMDSVVAELRAVRQAGVQVGVVVGGGNFLRGRDLADNPRIARTTADYMGMLATNMNGLALRDSLESHGVKATLFSAIPDTRFCEPFNRRQVIERLDAGHVVIFSGGTGNPFFTTDTCAALRAAEISADALFKATTVDGVYDSDPKKNPHAKKYDKLTYAKVLADRLGVMDLTAISLCMERNLPIFVFPAGQLATAVAGENVGTIITG